MVLVCSVRPGRLAKLVRLVRVWTEARQYQESGGRRIKHERYCLIKHGVIVVAWCLPEAHSVLMAVPRPQHTMVDQLLHSCVVHLVNACVEW